MNRQTAIKLREKAEEVAEIIRRGSEFPTPLPVFKEPSSLEEAALLITQLGKNMGEHAYLVGKILIWVKTQLKHGEFLNWIEEKVWFKNKTAENFINFAKKCDEQGSLLDEPHYLERSKFVNFTNLEPLLLPLGKYRVIYADPPWQYQNVGLAGSAEKHYRTLSVEEIINYEDSNGRRVPDLMTDTTVLFLWVPNSFLREGLEVIEGWGFEYKANFVWIKHKMAYGKLAFYNYGQHEFLFIAVKGSCLPIKGSLVPSVLQAKKGKHSKKPEKMYEIIESMYPPPYIELFARDKREGWDSWGAEIG